MLLKFAPLCRFGENLLDRSKAEPMCPGIRENTMASFNAACDVDADFVEFDVQVCRHAHRAALECTFLGAV
jgi:glycerophosphoryl diester phosphodiesterase